MKTVAEITAAIKEKSDAVKALIDKGDQMTPEDVTAADALDTEQKALMSELEQARKLDEIKARNAQAQSLLWTPTTSLPSQGAPQGQSEMKAFTLPARVRGESVKNFKSDGADVSCPLSAHQKAYAFGAWFASCLDQVSGTNRFAKASQWCREHGLEVKLNQENVNTSGGFLVPDIFANDLIVLREKYGVFRQNVAVRTMTSDVLRIPRRTGGATAYWVAEGAAGTVTTPTWDQVTLVAKKLMAIVKLTNELSEDAFINVGDYLAGEIAYNMAYTEDDTGFNGDGTSTYAGITGVTTAMNAVSNSYKVQTGTGAFSSTLADYQAVVGMLPQYADGPNARWYCHRAVWAGSMQVAELAAGGVQAVEVINGVRTPTFLGYPVVISQSLLGTYAANKISVILGDLSLAAKMGDRRQLTLSVSEHATVGSENVWERDEVAIRGTERIDIVVHDIGTSSVRGPLVALRTNSS